MKKIAILFIFTMISQIFAAQDNCKQEIDNLNQFNCELNVSKKAIEIYQDMIKMIESFSKAAPGSKVLQQVTKSYLASVRDRLERYSTAATSLTGAREAVKQILSSCLSRQRFNK